MQPVATTVANPVTPPARTQAAADPRAGGGVQGVIGDVLRGAGAGYAQATKQTGVQADKAAIHPLETVSTATGLLKQKTAHIKGVNRATGILHTVGGFGMLILTANASGTLRMPGQTASELAHTVADLVDGKDTVSGFSGGWFMPPAAGREPVAPPASSVGSALGSLGMR